MGSKSVSKEDAFNHTDTFGIIDAKVSIAEAEYDIVLILGYGYFVHRSAAFTARGKRSQQQILLSTNIAINKSPCLAACSTNKFLGPDFADTQRR
jgi:recombinational DNA repair protein RecT